MAVEVPKTPLLLRRRKSWHELSAVVKMNMSDVLNMRFKQCLQSTPQQESISHAKTGF